MRWFVQLIGFAEFCAEVCSHPEDREVSSGESVILSVTATGHNLKFTWQRTTPPCEVFTDLPCDKRIECAAKICGGMALFKMRLAHL